jgi:hypothetical protein
MESLTAPATVTILRTMTVKRLVIGTNVYNMPEGTSDVNAMTIARPYIRSGCWMARYAGSSRDEATMVVVTLRGYSRDLAAKAEARLAKLVKKYGGELPEYKAA